MDTTTDSRLKVMQKIKKRATDKFCTEVLAEFEEITEYLAH